MAEDSLHITMQRLTEFEGSLNEEEPVGVVST